MSDETAAEKRSEAQSAAFEESTEPTEVAGLKLRPFTSFSFERCQRFDVQLALANEEGLQEMPGLEVLRGTAAIAWMLSQPQTEVSKVCREGKEAFWDAVEIFEGEFNKQIDAAEKWLVLVREVGNVMVKGKLIMFRLSETAETKKSAKDGEAPPPNS